MRTYFFRIKLLASFIVLLASNVSPIQAKQEVSPSDSPLFFNGMTTDLNAGAPKVLAKRFENKTLKEIDSIVFGHWAALKGVTNNNKIKGVDLGCVWGGSLAAININDRSIITVDSQK